MPEFKPIDDITIGKLKFLVNDPNKRTWITNDVFEHILGDGHIIRSAGNCTLHLDSPLRQRFNELPLVLVKVLGNSAGFGEAVVLEGDEIVEFLVRGRRRRAEDKIKVVIEFLLPDVVIRHLP
jgi:hypothetical protein